MNYLEDILLAYLAGAFLSILALALFSKGYPSVSGILFGASVVVSVQLGKFAGIEKSV